jgi:hypothetical protein
MAGFLKAARTEDVRAGQGKKVSVGGKHIALFNLGGATMRLMTHALTKVARYPMERSKVLK